MYKVLDDESSLTLTFQSPTNSFNMKTLKQCLAFVEYIANAKQNISIQFNLINTAIYRQRPSRSNNASRRLVNYSDKFASQIDVRN